MPSQRNGNLILPRRNFLGEVTHPTLSTSIIGLLAEHGTLAQAQSADAGKDVATFTVAQGLEYKAIGAYQVGV